MSRQFDLVEYDGQMIFKYVYDHIKDVLEYVEELRKHRYCGSNFYKLYVKNVIETNYDVEIENIYLYESVLNL